jgi:hypothetical protein
MFTVKRVLYYILFVVAHRSNRPTLIPTPALLHVFESLKERSVIGMTLVNGRLYVLRQPTTQQIFVYDAETFEEQRSLLVKVLSQNGITGMTSSSANMCLYVGDVKKSQRAEGGEVRNIHIVCLSEGKRVASSWSCKLTCKPAGLSINSAHNLLVACPSVIREYKHQTENEEHWIELLREILIPHNWSSRQAIQLAVNELVVCTWTGSEDDVIKADINQQEDSDNSIEHFTSYAKLLHSRTGKTLDLNPGDLSIAKNNTDTYILVADTSNNRVVILNHSEETREARELDVASVTDGLKKPRCLHFDESSNRLFVGESKTAGRILVFGNVI